MQKIISSGNDAMLKIKQGVDLVANPVKSTISPMGRTVIIGRSNIENYDTYNEPIEITKDGYKVTQNIRSSDPQIQVGVKLIQEAAEKQMKDAGDGTSTVCLLTQALLDGGLELIEKGASHVEVVKGINEAVAYVVGELKKMAIPIDGDIEKIRNVATVCSNNDKEIGDLIAEAFSKIGADGVIDIEEAKGRETTIKVSDGIKYPAGWASQYFVNNFSKGECVLENPYILIYDRIITQLEDRENGGGIMPLLNKIFEYNSQNTVKRPLLIICDKIEGDALATLTANHQRGIFFSCATEVRWMGEFKNEFLEDVAAATGGTYISELKGSNKLENVQVEDLGQAKKVIIRKDETVIVEGLKDKDVFNSLVDSVKKQELEADGEEAKEKIRKRLARLNGSIAVLSVGATTEVEMKEKKDRIDDAVRAVRSGVEEGILCGGGSAFLRCLYPTSEDGKTAAERHGTIGFEKSNMITHLINCVLQKSLEQVCINSGVDYTKIKGIILSNDNVNYGYNAKADSLEDLLLAGIIEPLKSNRCALQNAASVVCQILNSYYTITDTL